jgi:glutamyl-tRNA reductase
MRSEQEPVTSIRMAGIDYSTAAIEIREKFALTSTAQAEMLKSISSKQGVLGSVVINTCNRMELWLSCSTECSLTPFEAIIDFFKLESGACEAYFIQRNDKAAVYHLFELACGLKSMIFGEEQILTQVKEAISFAKECNAADAVLQALYRQAVTAAKKAKTEVRLAFVNRSAADSAVGYLKNLIGDLNGLSCLVIGSGEMGRLAAKALVTEGCEVTMTLRRYKTGDSIIPSGCKAVDYESRYKRLRDSKIIISATRSPHHTLEYVKTAENIGGDEKLMFDLALPRDIDPEIAKLSNIRLFDIDHLGGRLIDEADNECIAKVRTIIRAEIEEFERWKRIRSLIPKINEISNQASSEVEERLSSSLKSAALDENCLRLIREAAVKAVYKTVENTLLKLYKEQVDINKPAAEKPLNRAAANYRDGALPPRFPLFVDLSGRKIVVIGAGNIALRRILSLCNYPCRIVAVAPSAHEQLLKLYEQGRIEYINKVYEPSDLEGAYLVIAATDNRELNHKISSDAEHNRIFCSVADNKEECSFFFPATVHYNGGVVAVCGTGENHRQTKEIAAEISNYIKARINK